MLKRVFVSVSTDTEGRASTYDRFLWKNEISFVFCAFFGDRPTHGLKYLGEQYTGIPSRFYTFTNLYENFDANEFPIARVLRGAE